MTNPSIETVSTAQTLMSAMRLTNALAEKAASVVHRGYEKAKKTNWMSFAFSGLGVTSGFALLSYFKANPGSIQELRDTVDLLTSPAVERDYALEKAAEESRSFENAKLENQTVQPKILPQEVPKAVSSPDVQPSVVKVPPPPPLPKVTQSPQPPAVVPQTTIKAPTEKQAPRSAPKQVDKRLAVPTEVINKILQNTAKNEGVDYPTLYALAGAESSFSSGAKAGNSTATGLLQFTTGTWDYLTKKVYPELGYSLSDRLDPEKSAIVASRYIKHISAILEKAFDRKPSTGEVYLGYFMGPSGAVAILKALQSDPNTLGHKVFPKAAKANPTLFFEKGDTSKPLTLLQTFSLLDNKVSGYARAATQQSVQVASETTALPVPAKATVRPNTPVARENVQTPKMQAVVSIEADFTSEGKRKTPPPVKQAKAETVEEKPGLFLSNTPPTRTLEYATDKHGRIIAVST